MKVLVDVAGALQRTRTGLRVLLDLLVDRRDVLEVGQLVPVGDLYDVIDSSDDPFSDAMRSAFDQARKIYKERLLPALRADHGLALSDEPTTAFVNDDRLIKTLLLAALVPQSVPFKNLTVEGLVALNHGTIASPVPGQETSIATNKLNRLASQVGELRLGGDPNNPTVAVVLSDVDTSAILATADGVDNMAKRRTLVRELVMNAIGLPSGQMTSTYSLIWNGLRRDVTVLFGNVRDAADLPDSMFANDGPGWKLVVDFPFDDHAHSPLEDLERLDRFRQNGSSWSTLCWLPAFFTASTVEVLSRLVRLNHVLANDQMFAEATSSLSPQARASAKPMLEAMQSSARSQLEAALLGAYGVVSADERVVDTSHSLSDHFPSLKTGLTIAPPTKASLRAALDQVLDQALRYTFPGAPDLGSEVKPTEVRRVADLCADAVVEPDGRLVVADHADRRLLARIANPLELGIQSEQAFKVTGMSDRWDKAFTQAIGRDRQNGSKTQTVGLLRAAIDDPDARGLTTQLENLIILVWAQTTNHTFQLHGGPAGPSVDHLEDAWEIVPQALPSQADWDTACDRLASVFGINLSTLHLSGFAVERAGIDLAQRVVAHQGAAAGLVERLRNRASELEIDEEGLTRLPTALAAQALLDAVAAAEDDITRLEALAKAPIPTSPLALGKSISSAAVINAELDASQFAIIKAACDRPGGASLRADLVSAFEADELVTGLVPVLHQVQADAIKLVTGDKPTPPSHPIGKTGSTWVGRGISQALQQLQTIETEITTSGASGDEVEITMSWIAPDSPSRDAKGTG
jgi:hypothetical protein